MPSNPDGPWKGEEVQMKCRRYYVVWKHSYGFVHYAHILGKKAFFNFYNYSRRFKKKVSQVERSRFSHHYPFSCWLILFFVVAANEHVHNFSKKKNFFTNSITTNGTTHCFWNTFVFLLETKMQKQNPVSETKCWRKTKRKL